MCLNVLGQSQDPGLDKRHTRQWEVLEGMPAEFLDFDYLREISADFCPLLTKMKGIVRMGIG